MNNETIPRLRVLRHYMHSLPVERFDLSVWSTVSSCGTVACVLGHACELDYFNWRGLHFNGFDIPAYKDHTGQAAGCRFFGLEPSDAAELFKVITYREHRLAMYHGYTQKEIAIKRLDDLVEKLTEQE